MYQLIKVVLTTAVVVAIAWPLLFWGPSASSKRIRHPNYPQPLHYNILNREVNLW